MAHLEQFLDLPKWIPIHRAHVFSREQHDHETIGNIRHFMIESRHDEPPTLLQNKVSNVVNSGHKAKKFVSLIKHQRNNYGLCFLA